VRSRLTEAECKLIELLKVSEALEMKLSQSEQHRCDLQAQLDRVTASNNQRVSILQDLIDRSGIIISVQRMGGASCQSAKCRVKSTPEWSVSLVFSVLYCILYVF